MKKPYREDEFQDDGGSQIDADTGDVINGETEEAKKEKPNNAKIMGVLIDWAVTRREGKKFLCIQKQYAALKRLRIAKIPPSKIKERWEELEGDRYYANTGIDFWSIVHSFDKKP